jgi:release factor glutamine methyltransferase
VSSEGEPPNTQTIAEWLRWATGAFEAEAIHAPRLTSEVLLAHAVGQDRAHLFAHSGEIVGLEAAARFARFVAERSNGKPTQYITGHQEFYGLDFRVTPDVLIPRPETELLVEIALEKSSGAEKVIDVGTGSGAIAVAFKANRPTARVIASDTSQAALELAAGNARRLQTSIWFAQCDLLDAFAGGSFDMVVSNPPYVPLDERPGLQREVRDFEPASALFAGADGLDCYRRLIRDAPRVLRPRGWLIVELGYNSRSAVLGLLNAAHWGEPEIFPDLAGFSRILAVAKQ